MRFSMPPLFLSRFLPVALLIVALTWFYEHSEHDSRLALIKSDEVLNVSLASSSLVRHIDSIFGDLHFITDHFAMKKLVNDPNSPEIERVETNFQSLLRAKKVYNQIRWIDSSGQEIVSVVMSDVGPRLLSRQALENQGQSYYFTGAMRQDAHTIYVSPLDLNVRGGKIEEPRKPLLRLAMPVADNAGEKRGVVLIDYLGKTMIDRFIELGSSGQGHISLLNAEGYWLHASDPNDEWGFMYNDPTRTLAARFPASWARMKEHKGQFEDEHGLWTYESVHPLNPSLHDHHVPSDSSAETYRWVAVSHIDPQKLAALTQTGGNGTWLFALALILLAAFIIHALLTARQREKEGQERFRAIFDYAMVGIATLSPDKVLLSVNPALCRILGYGADMLLRATWSELTHPDDREADTRKLDAVLEGKSDGYSMEKRFIGKDGSVIHTTLSARAIRKAGGKVDFLVLIIEDISNWVLAENEWSSSVNTLQRFIDHLPGTAYIKSADSQILLASKGFIELFGMDPNQLVGRRSIEVFPGEFGEKIVADDARVLASGQTERIEDILDGRIYESTKFVIPRDDGQADIGGITIDVTERRQNEIRLALQARRSAVLLELPMKAEELSEKAFMQYALEQAEALTESLISFMHFVNEDGVTIELVAWSHSTLQNYCTAAFDNHYPISEAGLWAEAARQKKPIVVNDYAAANNKKGLPPGHSALSRLLSIPVMEEGVVRMMTGVGNKTVDYTEFDVETVQLVGSETWRIVRRQRSEKALRLAMQVVNASPVVCFRWEASEGWPVIFVSENVAQWGYKADDLKSGATPFARLIHPEDRKHIADKVSHHDNAGAEGYEQEYRLLTANGDVIWVVDRTIVVRDSDDKPLFYDGVLTDITERRKQQLILSETLAQQKKLNKRLEDANNQLMQSEKMASIGQLAAGVAHELNNPIGFVHSNLGTLDGYVRDLMAIVAAYERLILQAGEPEAGATEIRKIAEQHDFEFLKGDIFSLLAESKDGLGRVRKIVQDLKNFSRVGEQEWQEADLHQGIDSTLNIVWNELKYKAKVVKEYGDIPHIFCLISQLNQVFMNLLVNAGHAIQTQGTITIRTSLRDDDTVCVEISDTGQGIAPEHINRIFDPFFTTKPVGKGTGLGLSLSYGIVKRHSGRIEVESVVGEGTTFRLLLPVNPKHITDANNSETSP
ncbi:MAG: hypothetical protein H6R14_588 [Proteobacteria bacterium]|nr:hypothetical protein [Pseudomonadota bacterium]